MTGKKTDIIFSISRTSDDLVNIRVKDKLSAVEFISASMELQDYARLITGQAYIPAKAELRGLEYVGKQVQREVRSVVCPLNTYSTENIKKWFIANCQEDGWILDTYLGSQNSISPGYGNCVINYSVYRYIEGSE